MVFFKHTEIDNPVRRALLDYQNDLERGSYDTLQEYTPDDFPWTTLNELDFLEDLLKSYLLQFPIAGVNLRARLETELPIGFPKIVNLWASLNLLEKKDAAGSLKALLNTETIAVQIAAGIPGPSLVHLTDLQTRSIDDRERFGLLNLMVRKLEKTANEYGTIGHLLLKIAVNDWVQAYNQLPGDIQETFVSKKEKYERQASVYLPDNKLPDMSLVEQCTISSLEKFSSNIEEKLLAENIAALKPRGACS